jgi:hypothetical protein
MASRLRVHGVAPSVINRLFRSSRSFSWTDRRIPAFILISPLRRIRVPAHFGLVDDYILLCAQVSFSLVSLPLIMLIRYSQDMEPKI